MFNVLQSQKGLPAMSPQLKYPTDLIVGAVSF